MGITVNTAGLLSSSGFDVQGLVDQMMQAAQAPEQVWKDQQTTLSSEASALKSLSSNLSALHTSVESLTDVLGAFAQRTASSSDDSIVSAANRLHGSLLLVHGTSDDNVHFQNTIQMTDALIRAGKQFRLMLYPDKTHGISGPGTRTQLFHMMEDFWNKELK